jgi:hypothetical protein
MNWDELRSAPPQFWIGVAILVCIAIGIIALGAH